MSQAVGRLMVAIFPLSVAACGLPPELEGEPEGGGDEVIEQQTQALGIDPEYASALEERFSTHGSFQGGRIITRWIEQALEAVRAQNVGTAPAGRLYAMVAGAMYDAVNGIDRARFIGREPAIVLPPGAPWLGRRDVAAAVAAHTVLTALVPGHQAQLDAALAEDAEVFGPGHHVQLGWIWGYSVGQAVVEARSADGTQSPEILEAGSGPGVHRADFDARFRQMTPFGIESKAPYASPGPPDLNSRAYAKAFNDVKRFGVQDGDPERNAISDFWLAGAGSVRETGSWFQAGLAIVRDRGTDQFISPTARLFALLGMAIADSTIVSWEAKATYFFWRPTIAIREGDMDGNRKTRGDATWTSRTGSVGASPEHTSGTSTFAGASSQIIEAFYCTRRLPFCFESDGSTTGERCYSRPWQGAKEAGRSRIYQGIHFQFSNQEGLSEGRRLAEEISENRLERVGLLAGLRDCAR